jgi:hypothetical protein
VATFRQRPPRRRIDHVQRARAVGDGRHAQAAVDARRGVGREAHAGLVRQRVQRQDLRLFDDAEVGQGEVAGNAKDLARAMVFERVQQGFGEVHAGQLRFIRQCGHCAAHRVQGAIVLRLI